MKRKVILSVLLMAFMGTTLLAQEETKKKRTLELPKAGDIALGIDVVPMFKYVGNFFNGTTDNAYNTFGGESAITFDNPINNPTVSIMGKYMITDTWAARLNVGILYTHKNTRTYKQNDAALLEDPLSLAKVVDENIVNNTGASFALGAEYRRGYRRIQGFAGGNLIYAFGEYNRHYNYGNAITEVNQTPTRAFGGAANPVQDWTAAYITETFHAGNTQYIGLSAHVGVEIFLASHLSIGGEVSLCALGAFERQSFQKLEGYNLKTNTVETRTELDSPGDTSFTCGTGNLGGKLYMMFYF